MGSAGAETARRPDIVAVRQVWLTQRFIPTHEVQPVRGKRVDVRPQPYSLSLLNISAMSFGALSASPDLFNVAFSSRDLRELAPPLTGRNL